jgi:beta-lactamase class D/glyoxylase-like metal-dependent hydrolase (beta-lactamase superfamily II)
LCVEKANLVHFTVVSKWTHSLFKYNNQAIMKFLIFLISFFCISINIFSQTNKSVTRDDFQKYFDNAKVRGSFLLYDVNNDLYIMYNSKESENPKLPASTFKIFNTLVGLETGVIADENFELKWDSIQRQNTVANQNHKLQTAFQNSIVWYYQEVARRIGKERMKYWLKKVQYGNQSIEGGIDLFWLTGELRISPKQMMEFLQKLHFNKLPFSNRTIEITKKIMIREEKPEYILRAKTGSGEVDNTMIGWYVGIVETYDNSYIFVNFIESNTIDYSQFVNDRIEIVNNILKDLQIIPPQKLKITHLKDNYYLYETYNFYKQNRIPATGMYCVTKEGVVMIDSPWDTTQIQPLLDSIHSKHNQKVVLCIATHFHEDRTGCLNYLNSQSIPTFTSKMTYDLCIKNNKPISSNFFMKDTTFQIGGKTFETYYPGAGHTIDNIIVLCNDEKILYGGCFAKSTVHTDLGFIGDADIPEWKHSIEKVMKKFPNPHYVIPGHDSWKSNKSLQHTLKLIRKHR